MTTFLYNENIPAAGNNPSNDQPLMYINTNSIDALIAVDHVSFNADSGGQHVQVTYTAPINRPTIGSDKTFCIEYTSIFTPQGSDVQNGLVQEYLTIPQVGAAIPTFPISGIKAMCSFNANAGSSTISNSFNISSFTYTVPNYVFTLQSGILSTSQQAIVLITDSLGGSATYTYTAATNPTLSIGAIRGAAHQVSFIVLQI